MNMSDDWVIIGFYMQNDGLHFRHQWVFAIKEEVKGLLSRVDEMAAQIDELKDQIKRVTCP